MGNIAVILVASVLSAFTLYVFVYPADFAPSGVDGIATMLQSITGLNAGYYNLIINLPLMIAALFFLRFRWVAYTVVYTLVSSALIVLLEAVGFYQYIADGGLLAAFVSGALLGIRTGLMLRSGGSTGGIDIIACIVQKRGRFRYIEKVMVFICVIIILLSWFVYHSVDSILIALVQMFVYERAIASVLKDSRSAVEFKIVTKHPEEVRNTILYSLKHGATVVDGHGMYTGDGSAVILTVINIRQVPNFLNEMKKHPDTFVYYSDVSGVQGNFRWFRSDAAK